MAGSKRKEYALEYLEIILTSTGTQPVDVAYYRAAT